METILTAVIGGGVTLIGVVEEQIKVINHRIEDLEGFHKPN